jgi:putative spermidine/putrescine transport system ATP-binding protein
VFEPKIILMDEPLSALDKQLRELMQVELRRLHARIEATIIYVTHDQREALTMSDRIAVIDKGRVVQFGSPQSVYERPEHRFVAEFLGESALIPVERAGPSQVRLGDMILASERTLPDASGLLLVVRAETLSFAREGDVNRLPAIVSEVIYQGDSVLLMVTLAQRFQLAMRHPAHQHALGTQPAEGDPVTLALHPSKVIVIPS